jgi:hypothetical protein
MKIFLPVLMMTLAVMFVTDVFSIEAGNAFAEKMSYYFNKSLSFSMRDLPDDSPTGWWAATLAEGHPLACTNIVYLDTRWYGSHSPLWKYALVHEWVHTTQGTGCVNNERNTDLEALYMLAKADEWKAFIQASNLRISQNRLTQAEVNAILERINAEG